MLAVVGGSVQWAARAQRRRNLREERRCPPSLTARRTASPTSAARSRADDSADFILQAAYEKCAGIMTFGPGSTYGEDGAGADGAYYVRHRGSASS